MAAIRRWLQHSPLPHKARGPRAAASATVPCPQALVRLTVLAVAPVRLDIELANIPCCDNSVPLCDSDVSVDVE